MKLIDLRTLDGYTPNLFIKVSLRRFKMAVDTDGNRLQLFKDKWVSEQATLSDWMAIGPVVLDNLISDLDLSKTKISKLKARQRSLYILYLECNLQYKRLVDFRKILERTPDQTPDYALSEIERVKLLIGNASKSTNYDIHDSNSLKENELFYYKSFLESFVKDPHIESINDGSESLLHRHFIETLRFLRAAIIKTTYEEHEEGGIIFRSWQVLSFNNHSIVTLRTGIKSIFNAEFRELLNELTTISTEKQEEFLNVISNQLLDFKNEIFVDTNYRYQNEDSNEVIIESFKRLKKVSLHGTHSFEIALNNSEGSTYNYILYLAKPYFVLIEEELSRFINKLQETADRLELVNFSQNVRERVSPDGLSFTYTGKYDENLTQFITGLRDAGFIEPNTSMPSAKKAFLGSSVKSPIVWQGKIGQLTWLIKHLITSNYIEPVGNRLWEITAHCFILPGAIKLKQDQLRKAKMPTETSKLEVICNRLG